MASSEPSGTRRAATTPARNRTPLTGHVAYYAHQWGHSHLARGAAIAAHLDLPVTLLSEVEPSAAERAAFADVVTVPPDGPTTCSEPTARGALQWAPLDPARIAPRSSAIGTWLAQHRPDLLVADGSVEVCVLARLFGVAPVAVRLLGERIDRAHILAYDCAIDLVAPYTAVLEPEVTPLEISQRTFHAGLVCPADDRHPASPGHEPAARSGASARSVAVVWDRSGPPPSHDELAEAARSCPDWSWTYIGPMPRLPPAWTRNLTILGPDEDPTSALRDATVVVGTASTGAIGEVAQLDRPFVCLPQLRPLGEQEARASALERAGAAVTHPGWPAEGRWPDLLERAVGVDPARRRAAMRTDGAARTAAHLAELVAARRAGTGFSSLTDDLATAR